MAAGSRLLLLAALAAGCSAPAAAPVRPAPLLHLVWVTLHDPADAPALQRDCEELLADIPGVVAFAAGPPVDTGRGESVWSGYHVGLLVGFSGEDGYRDYLAHAGHDELLRRWRPRIAALQVADFRDAGAPSASGG